MKLNDIIDGFITIILIVLLIIVLTMVSCSPKYPNIHTPTKREIKKAMKYSTSQYRMVRLTNYQIN
jgi:hypothetical protein